MKIKVKATKWILKARLSSTIKKMDDTQLEAFIEALNDEKLRRKKANETRRRKEEKEKNKATQMA